jgi:GNAT superfamily N-acetyltransferase
MDLLAYRIDPRASLPPRIEKLAALARADPAIVLRRPDYSRFEQEIGTVLDLFNDAWAGNWGFEPFTPAHIREMAHELKPILPPQAVCIAERDGRPVAFALGLPDINEMIRDLGGRLLPFGWAKLLFRLRTGRFHGGRLLLMGVRKEFQTQPLGAALAVAVIDRLRSECLRHRVHDVELSWVLETNRGVRSLLEAFGAEVYKRYRLYSRQIAQTVETRFGPEQ